MLVPSAAVLVAAPTASSVTGYPVERVSVSSSGVEGDFDSYSPTISSDGRYVAFFSDAANLVSGDTNATGDIFVRDRQLATTDRVSVSTGGTQSDGQSFGASMSANGRSVAFSSNGSGLVPGDTNATTDVFVRDLVNGTTERVSVSTTGTEGDEASTTAAISADGRYVVFYSGASTLVPGDTNGVSDIFLRDRQMGTTERVSISGSSTEADNSSYVPGISGDGRFVAFASYAANLVAGDVNNTGDIFLRDRQLGTTERVSLSSAEDEANDNSATSAPSISADGRLVMFTSYAANLVPGDGNGLTDVFIRDRQAGTTERVSTAAGGGDTDGYSIGMNMSSDGRYAAFTSQGSNVIANDTNGDYDFFLRDRQAGTNERASVSSAGDELAGASYYGAVTDDGRYVAFDSFAPNVVSGDTNGVTDVFVQDRLPAPPSNQAPTCSNGGFSMPEESHIGFTVSCSDPENDALTYSIVTPPSHGTATTTGANDFNYTPAFNYYGPDSFTFRANDGALDSNTATVSFNVSPIADLPSFTLPTRVNASEFEGLLNDFFFSFSDPDGQPSSAFIVDVQWGDGTTSHLTSAADWWGPGSTTYDLNVSHLYKRFGVYSVRIALTDTNAGTVARTTTIAVKDAPIFVGSTGQGFARRGQKWSVRITCFEDENPYSVISDFTATVKWGDGTSSTAKVKLGTQKDPNGADCRGWDYGVHGSHIYTKTGTFKITITVLSVGGSSGTGKSSVRVVA